MARTPKEAAKTADPKGDDTGSVRRWIEVVDPLSHDGDTYQPGDAVLLTRTQFDQLARAGVVGGVWDHGEAVQPD